MPRFSIFTDAERFRNCLKAVEAQLKDGVPAEKITAKLNAQFQEKEVERLLGHVIELAKGSIISPLQKWFRISSLVLFFSLLVNSIALAVLVWMDAELETNALPPNLSASGALLRSLVGLVLSVPIVVNAFKESYLSFMISFMVSLYFIATLGDIFVIFAYQSIFFYPPYLALFSIWFIMFKLNIRKKRQNYLYAKQEIEKMNFDLSLLNKNSKVQDFTRKT